MNKHFVFLFFICLTLAGQTESSFSPDALLRGSITPEREWWDLTFYHLDITVNPEKKYISGKNTIRFKALKEHQIMQVDLQPPLRIDKVLSNGTELAYKRRGKNAYLILFDSILQKNTN